jgi:hypothetical protein
LPLTVVFACWLAHKENLARRGKYAKSIGDLKEPENKETALQCLNEMVTNAMTHINDSLDYMTLLSHPNVFKFCCIPQAMAIATLARIYNNYDVFKKAVKIRKGEAVQIMMYGGDYETIISYFVKYIKEVCAPTPFFVNTALGAPVRRPVLTHGSTRARADGGQDPGRGPQRREDEALHRRGQGEDRQGQGKAAVSTITAHWTRTTSSPFLRKGRWLG